ncbi:MAG: YbaY family lipoprotein [Rhodospirillales bacterium]|nr:MAG: YbaY family lipoprotein [Rhodospirillales bacterium]
MRAAPWRAGTVEAGMRGGHRRWIAVVGALAAAAPAAGSAQGDGEGISSTAISRCAGKVGIETREKDQAFGAIALDGMPWVLIERTEEMVGSQAIATTVSGTGVFRRREGTTVAFRFVCMIAPTGAAVSFHSAMIDVTRGETLPPSTMVRGAAALGKPGPVPRGAELRVQLLDTAARNGPEILAEQVVRSGWQAPIPFGLRVPGATKFDGRTLVVTARVVLAGKTLAALKAPRPVTADELKRPLELTLE